MMGISWQRSHQLFPAAFVRYLNVVFPLGYLFEDSAGNHSEFHETLEMKCAPSIFKNTWIDVGLWRVGVPVELRERIHEFLARIMDLSSGSLLRVTIKARRFEFRRGPYTFWNAFERNLFIAAFLKFHGMSPDGLEPRFAGQEEIQELFTSL